MSFVALSHIDHVGLRVADLDRALPFYARLGFVLTYRAATPALATLRTPTGIELNLVAGAEPRLGHPNVLLDDPVKRPGITHFALAVESIVAAMAALDAAGIAVVDGPVVLGGKKKSVFIRDPDANLIELTELLPAS